jgi:predicted secreted protein
MQITSIAAIYFLFWVLSAFLMLPFGVRTPQDLDDETSPDLVPGQADSAPVNFRPGKLILRATILAAALTALFAANYDYGWITIDDIDVLPEPPNAAPR